MVIAMRLVLGVIACIALFALAACADDSPTDEERVRAVAEEFNAAWRAGDGKRTCELLNPDSAAAFNVPCPRYFSQTGKAVKAIRVEDVRVRGDTALVTAKRLDAERRKTTKLTVRRIGGEWLVSFG